MLDVYNPYKLIRVCGVPVFPVIFHCSGLFANGIEVQQRVVGHIAKAKMSVLIFGTFLRAVNISSVKWLTFSRLSNECGD